jgi:hypothetical protein
MSVFGLHHLSLSWRPSADIYARVFVVTMTQTFIHFLHYHRTKEYMEYLCSTDVEQQRASTAYLSTTETEFFALDSEYGRRNAVCNLLGLVKFWVHAGEDGTTEVEGVEGIEGSHEEVESGPAFDDAGGNDADGDDTDGGDADGGDADGDDADGDDTGGGDADDDDADGDDTDGDDADYGENDGWGVRDLEEDSDIDDDDSGDDEGDDSRLRKRKRCSS